MKLNRKRQSVLSLKVTDDAKRTVIMLAARLTSRDKAGRRWTLTDVMEEAIRVLAKRERVA